jgi:hypothetical protein
MAELLGKGMPPSLVRFDHKTLKSMGWWPAALLPASLFAIAAAAIFGGISLLGSHASLWPAPAALATGSFIFVASVAVLLGLSREKRLEKEEVEACQRDCLDLYWALHEIDDRTLKGLTWVNFKQLRVFAAIAQRQARMSYYASLAAAAVALLVLTSGAVVAVDLPTTSAKLAAGGLSTAGTTLAYFLAKTFLASYQMASHQMSYYYGQPLVHCYLLHAEWLAAEGDHKYGREEGRLLMERVIDACIKAGSDAQDHLLTLQEHDPGKSGTGSASNRGIPRQRKATPPVSNARESLSGANGATGTIGA